MEKQGLKILTNINYSDRNMRFLAEELKLARKRAGLTQAGLSNASGVSQSVIAKIENGKVDPAYSTVTKLFTALESIKKKTKTVGEVMHRQVYSAAPQEPLIEASKKMKKHGVSQLPVISGKSVVGCISEDDVLRAVEKNADLKKTKVKQAASPAPPIVSPETPIDAVTAVLHHAPMICVIDKGKLAGVITRADLLTVF